MRNDEDKWLEFCDVSKQLKVSIVYADFEIMLKGYYGRPPFTIQLAKHMLPGFTYKAFGRSSNTTIMSHAGTMIRLTSSLTVKSNWKNELVRVLRYTKPMILSDEENEAFQETTVCYMSNK